MSKNQTLSVIHTQSKYQNCLKNDTQKDFGIFLTNNIQTIDKILDIVDFEDDNLLLKKFLEPSCGNGIFIIRLLEKIFKRNIDFQEATHFIQSNLFFLDIDKKMVEKTKENISNLFESIYSQKYKGNFNGLVFDFTQRIRTKNKNLLFEPLLDVSLKHLLDKIDYVIGNPPYVSLYGRRDRKKDESQRIYYLNSYSQFPYSLKNGKINYIMLFLEHSIDFLSDNGKLSFILDVSFFETAYEYTRKYLLENTQILSLEYNIQDFEVASGQIILQFKKKKVKNHLVKIKDTKTNRQVEVDQSLWNRKDDQYRFRFNICSHRALIMDKIKDKKCLKLKDLYPQKNLRTCVMLLNMEKYFVFDKIQSDRNVKVYPYYQGSIGLKGKYEELKNTKYFHYDKFLQDIINDQIKVELTKKGIKNKKRLGLGESVIYDNAKIYIRQSAKEMIASLDLNSSAANNSLYVFTLRDSSERSLQVLKYLCGLFNSNLITFYAQQFNIIRFSQGKQPQIKISDLYQIPVPTDSSLQNEIIQLVEKIYSKLKDDKEQIKNKINELIFDYFHISDKEKKTIHNSISTF